jgi:hypothetical protein
MPINLQGVELLKADLRANAKDYKQSTFGRVTECGTEQCMAGFCYLREVGQEAYVSTIIGNSDSMETLCVGAGVKQLGIDCDPEYCLDIFGSHHQWPYDLTIAYINATPPEARVEVACAALDRLNDDGTIKERE